MIIYASRLLILCIKTLFKTPMITTYNFFVEVLIVYDIYVEYLKLYYMVYFWSKDEYIARGYKPAVIE